MTLDKIVKKIAPAITATFFGFMSIQPSFAQDSKVSEDSSKPDVPAVFETYNQKNVGKIVEDPEELLRYTFQVVEKGEYAVIDNFLASNEGTGFRILHSNPNIPCDIYAAILPKMVRTKTILSVEDRLPVIHTKKIFYGGFHLLEIGCDVDKDGIIKTLGRGIDKYLRPELPGKPEFMFYETRNVPSNKG